MTYCGTGVSDINKMSFIKVECSVLIYNVGANFNDTLCVRLCFVQYAVCLVTAKVLFAQRETLGRDICFVPYMRGGREGMVGMEGKSEEE